MVLTLSNLKAVPGKKKKRRGRGNSSGRGNYSTRGMKGQRSRSGGKNKLKRRGLKQFLHQIPKSRGFKSIHPSSQVVNVSELEQKFDSGAIVNVERLVKEGLIKKRKGRVKILGSAGLKKKLVVQAHYFSKSAEAAIKKAGGEAKSLIAKVNTQVKKKKKK